MWSRAMRRSDRSRSSTQLSLRPRIDDLESRLLLAVPPLVAHPMFEIGPVAGGLGPSGGYTPVQIRQAYGFNNITFGGVAGDGSGETIAIVDAFNDPNIQVDLNTFDAQFGLPGTTVAVYNQTGGASHPASDPTGDWEFEESLDVEWAHAMAPGASIMLVEASSANDSDLCAAVNYAAAHASVVSMSWGGGESQGETAYDAQDFDQTGVAFVASSGDAGAPASWPSTSPNVLSVGGTALTLGNGNAWSSEIGWSGSGGGPSAYESQPSYQHGVVTQTSSARATPDVAYDGSPSTGFAVYDSVTCGTSYGWQEVGGTSAGAPQWSALLAIADQGRTLIHQPALNSAGPQDVMTILYANQTDFHDIATGKSTGSPQYSAGPGYDYVTGLGSPIANLFVGSLAGTSSSSFDKLVLAAPTVETAGTSFNLSVSAQNWSGVTDTGYLGTIQFTSKDIQAGLPGNYTFTAADAGTHSFRVTLKTAGSQSVTATDVSASSITGTISGINASPAPASKFLLSGLPSTTTAGVSQTLTVIAEDPYGNVATGYGGTVQLTSSDPKASLPANFTFRIANQGENVFALTFTTAGTQSVTVTDSASSITAAQPGIAVQAAVARTLAVSGFPSSTMAGVASSITVTACDAYGNVATGYKGAISFSSSDANAILPSGFSFVAGDAGTHTFLITLDTAGAQWIAATDTAIGAITGTESGIRVRATPLVTWSSPASIVYGTPLSTVQLDAQASVPGSFVYTPALGAILHAGAGQSLSVTFTPTDATDYTMATGTTTISVTLATPSISLTARGGTFNGSPFPATVTIAGSSGTPGSSLEGIVPSLTYYSGSYSSLAELALLKPLPGATVRAGAYTVLAGFPATADYAAATVLASFTIAQATPLVTWSSPASIVYGTPLSTAQLDAQASVPGMFVYTPALGAILHAGAGQSLSVTFMPTDATDYTVATRTTPTTFTIGKGTPTIALANPGNSAVFGQTVTFVATVTAGAAPPGGTVTFYDGSTPMGSAPLDPSGKATLTAGALAIGRHSITAVYVGSADLFAATSQASTVSVGKAATQIIFVPNPVLKKKVVVSLSLTTQVQSIAPGVGVPSGMVTFEIRTISRKTITDKVLGTAALSGGSATLVVKLNSALKKTIVILYGGDGDFMSSTAMPPVLTQQAVKSLTRPMVALHRKR